jgi:hypothetical protein
LISKVTRPKGKERRAKRKEKKNNNLLSSKRMVSSRKREKAERGDMESFAEKMK